MVLAVGKNYSPNMLQIGWADLFGLFGAMWAS